MNGVWALYSLLSGVTNRVTLALDGFLGCVLWTTATVSCYASYWPQNQDLVQSVTTYAPPAAMSGDVALVLMSW